MNEQSLRSRIATLLVRLPALIVLAIDGAASMLRASWRGRIRGEAVEQMLNQTETVIHSDLQFSVLVPNSLCVYRARSFSTKEPETLEWIDGFEMSPVLWDIGANIGLYSLYAARRHRNARVYAFEPSVLNLELLARNIMLNDEVDAICVVPLPLFSQMQEDVFKLQQGDRGGALSAFSVDFGQDNRPLNVSLAYRTLGVSLDDMRRVFRLPQPNYIKLDVDGVEHLILRGGTEILSDPRLRSILVELNDDFQDQKEGAEEVLRRAGLQLVAKRRGESAYDPSVGQIWNNIWERA